jgi:hypothetical protein
MWYRVPLPHFPPTPTYECAGHPYVLVMTDRDVSWLDERKRIEDPKIIHIYVAQAKDFPKKKNKKVHDNIHSLADTDGLA